MVNRSLPDKWPIDAEILVNQNVPQPHDIGPWHRTVSLGNFRAQLRDGFTDDRQLLGHGVAKCLVGKEFELRPPGDPFPIQRFQEVV